MHGIFTKYPCVEGDRAGGRGEVKAGQGGGGGGRSWDWN
jgi:hypothetical protein